MEGPPLESFGRRQPFSVDPGFGASEGGKLEEPGEFTIRTGTEKAEDLSVNQSVIAGHALKLLVALRISPSRRLDIVRTRLPASEGDDDDGTLIDGEGRHHPRVRVGSGLRRGAPGQPFE